MAGLYEMSGLEFLSEDLEPSKYVAWWRSQCRVRAPLARDVATLAWHPASLEGGEIVNMPPARGMDYRNRFDYKGKFFVGTPTTAADMPGREERFKEYVAPWLKDPWGMWAKFRDELEEKWRPIKEFLVTKLETVRDHEISMWIDDEYWPVVRKAHRDHMLCMYPLCSLYMLFEAQCKELLGIDDTHISFRKLLQGYDHLVFQMDKKLWELGKLAEELGLRPIFERAEGREILTLLEETANGMSWIREFNEFISAHGWRNDTFHDSSTPGWIDDPTTPLDHIKKSMAKGGAFTLDALREAEALEREKLVAEFVLRIPEERKENFLALLRCAQAFQVFSEEHTFQVEAPFAATMYRIAREIGKRFERGGAIDNWDDVFYLSYDEMRYSIISYPMYDFRKLVARRKVLWEEGNKRADTEPVYIGDPSVAEPDPALHKIGGYGVVVEPIAGTLVTGIPGAPGVAEGIARVVHSVDQIREVQDGEILVTEVTWTEWTPLFARLKAAVTEWGGVLAHTAIVSREYGIPAVVSAPDARKKIKTGQRIRVDGNTGAVYALD